MEKIDEHYDALVRRLDVIIGLLLDLINRENKIIERDQMNRLRNLGLSNLELGKIFKKTPSQVAKRLYEVKRNKNK